MAAEVTLKEAAEKLLADLSFNNALNEAGWAFDEAVLKHTGVSTTTMLFNHAKPILLDTFRVYFENIIKGHQR